MTIFDKNHIMNIGVKRIESIPIKNRQKKTVLIAKEDEDQQEVTQ